MLNFSCRVINTTGEVVEINRNSKNQNELKIQLQNEGYSLLSIKQLSSASNSKLSKNEILQFTQTLSLLLNSNLSLNDSLNTAKISFKKGRLNSLLNTLIDGLKKGESFSDLISNPIWGLPKLYTGLIKVGEKTGNLIGIINQLNFYLDREKKLRDKLSGAMIYPIMIISISFAFSLFFTFGILPQFKTMFESFGGDVSNKLNKRAEVFTYLVIGSSVLILLFFLVNLYVQNLKKRDPVKAAGYEKIIFRIPILGKTYMNNQCLNFLFALNVLTESKLNIEEALLYAREVVNNSYLLVQVNSIREKIISGEKLSKSFNESAFPERISSFLEVGEKTGDINEVLNNLSDYYLKENNKEIDLFMALIDPLFTVLIGVGLLTMIILFILPLISEMGALF